MAGKKKVKKEVEKEVEKEVLVDASDEEAEPTPAPAIVEERTLKVVDKGHTTYYTQSEYDERYGKKGK